MQASLETLGCQNCFLGRSREISQIVSSLKIFEEVAQNTTKDKCEINYGRLQVACEALCKRSGRGHTCLLRLLRGGGRADGADGSKMFFPLVLSAHQKSQQTEQTEQTGWGRRSRRRQADRLLRLPHPGKHFGRTGASVRLLGRSASPPVGWGWGGLLPSPPSP